MLNLTDCLLKWSYLISIFSFDNNDVPQLVEKIIHFSEEDASEQYLVRGGKVFEIKVSIHQFERIKTDSRWLPPCGAPPEGRPPARLLSLALLGYRVAGGEQRRLRGRTFTVRSTDMSRQV